MSQCQWWDRSLEKHHLVFALSWGILCHWVPAEMGMGQEAWLCPCTRSQRCWLLQHDS